MQVSVISAPTFTRPNNTTPYQDTDLVANNTTAGSVVPLSFRIPNGTSGVIRSFQLIKSTTGTSGAAFTLHLYDSSPTPANGDNGALSTSVITNKIAMLAIPAMTSFSAGGAFGLLSGQTVHFNAGTDQYLYGLLECDGAYTPGAQETFTVSLVIEQ